MAEHLRVSIHQPAYLPYGGFFAKMLSSDIHIILDTVLYSRTSFQTRNRIRTPQGEAWLTVPVHGKKKLTLDSLMVDKQKNWPGRHWRTIVITYGKIRTAELEWIHDLKQERFVDVAEKNLTQLSKLLEIDVPIVRASDLRPNTAGQDADQRLIDLMDSVGGREYVSGGKGRDYMNLARWEEAGLRVSFCNWISLNYPQKPHVDFVPNLSVVDIIARMGSAAARELIEAGIVLETG